MTAKTNRPGWLVALARGLRPRPYWGKRLEDKLAPSGWFWGLADNLMSSFFDVLLLVVLLGMFTSLIASALIGPIFLSPGLLEHGLADPIGRGLAAVCLSTGQCELPYLLGGAALAVVILAAIVLVLVASMRVIFLSDQDEAEVSEPELLEALGEVHDLVVRLRSDLVIAGVLKVSADEQAEQEAELAPLREQAEAAP